MRVATPVSNAKERISPFTLCTAMWAEVPEMDADDEDSAPLVSCVTDVVPIRSATPTITAAVFKRAPVEA